MRHAINVAVHGGVAHRRIKHGGNEQVFVQLGDINRFVDAEFHLRPHDAVLRRLSEVKTTAACGAQLGDHLFVVGFRDFDGMAGLFFEFIQQGFVDIVRPVVDADRFGSGGTCHQGGDGDAA